MLGRPNRKYIETPSDPFVLPQVGPMPAVEGDFLAEVHRDRVNMSAIGYFGELLSKKKGSTADAKQKRE